MHHRVRALFRSAVRQLRRNDQIALVLDRQERGRDARQSVDSHRDEREREDDHQAGAARHCADKPGVSVLQPPVDRVEAAREKVAPPVRPARPEPQRGLRGLQGQGVDGADEGGGGDDQRELPVELSGEPRQESRGNEHGHQHQRDAEDRTGEIVHRPSGGLAAGQPTLDVTRDAFDNDDRVVDHDADRQHQGEQRREIDRKTQRRHRGEGADQRDRHRGRGHEHRPPVLQEDQDDDQHQDRRLDQRPVDLENGGPHEYCRVVGDHVLEPLGEACRQLVHLRLHLVGDLDGVGFRQERDGDSGGRPAVEVERLAVGLSAELDAADVADSGDLSAIGGIDLDDDVLELRRVVEPALEVERILKVLAFRRGRRADLPCGDFLTLLLDDVDHVLRHEAARLKQVRVQPDAHGVLPGAEHRHVAHAVEPTQFVLHVDDGVVRQEQAVEATVGRDKPDEFEDRGRLLLGRHALDLHLGRKRGQRDGHPVLDQDLRQIGVCADREGDRQGVGAVVGARRLHVDHVLHAVDVLLDRQGDGVDKGPCAGAGIARRDLHGRWDDVRILCVGQLNKRHEADEHDHQRNHVGENRPFDEEARNRARAAGRRLRRFPGGIGLPGHLCAGSAAPAPPEGSGATDASVVRSGWTFAPGKAR